MYVGLEEWVGDGQWNGKGREGGLFIYLEVNKTGGCQ